MCSRAQTDNLRPQKKVAEVSSDSKTGPAVRSWFHQFDRKEKDSVKVTVEENPTTPRGTSHLTLQVCKVFYKYQRSVQLE